MNISNLTFQTCTDIPCRWNHTFKESSVQPAPISDIKFYSKSATKSILCSSKKEKEFNGQSNIKYLLDLVSNKNPNTVALSVFMPHQKRFITEKSKNVLKLPKPLMQNPNTVTLSLFYHYLCHIKSVL